MAPWRSVARTARMAAPCTVTRPSRATPVCSLPAVPPIRWLPLCPASQERAGEVGDRSAGIPRGRSPTDTAIRARDDMFRPRARASTSAGCAYSRSAVLDPPPRCRSRRRWSCAVLVAVTSTVPRQGHARPTAREVGLHPSVARSVWRSWGQRRAAAGILPWSPGDSAASLPVECGRRVRALTTCTTRRRLRMGGRLRLYRVPSRFNAGHQHNRLPMAAAEKGLPAWPRVLLFAHSGRDPHRPDRARAQACARGRGGWWRAR
jgi:hypothetical protein